MSEEQYQKALAVSMQELDFPRLPAPDRRISFEELVLWLVAAAAFGGEKNASPEVVLPEQLGFEVRNGGTELFRLETEGDLAGFEIVFVGSGFVVDGDGNPTAGTVTDIKIRSDGDEVASLHLILQFAIGDLLDAIEAGTGDTYSPMGYEDLRELLVPSGAYLIGKGSSGADTFFGSDGNDRIDAKKGNDVLFMFEGNDKLDGNAGTDTIDARYVESGMAIDLAKGRATHGDFTTKLIDVENVIGSPFDDTIKGNEASNLIFGNDGDDILFGRGGKDQFVFADDGNTDQIKDFQDGSDKLGLQFFEFASKAAALAAFSEVGSNKDDKVQFDFEGTTVLITGADLKNITGADILI
jgi:Ca2+-binding RTX toxin-like protein